MSPQISIGRIWAPLVLIKSFAIVFSVTITCLKLNSLILMSHIFMQSFMEMLTSFQWNHFWFSIFKSFNSLMIWIHSMYLKTCTHTVKKKWKVGRLETSTGEVHHNEKTCTKGLLRTCLIPDAVIDTAHYWWKTRLNGPKEKGQHFKACFEWKLGILRSWICL